MTKPASSDLVAVNLPLERNVLDQLLPPALGDDFAKVQTLVAESGRKVVVLDDDPTGTQTVYGVPVLTEWSVRSLLLELAEPGSCFFILTNSRAMTTDAAMAVNREIARNLRIAAATVGRSFAVVSRSDSTLRGHFPAETDALAEELEETIDAVLLVPAFFEAGRITLRNIHYVADGDRLVPAGQTEFAQDRTFGYRSSNLTDWVTEKTRGRISPEHVAHFGLELLRGPEGAGEVERRLNRLPRGSVVTVDAVGYTDLEVFVHGLLRAEAGGRNFLARTAASFVRVRAGIEPRPLLAPGDIVESGRTGGLAVVGSYVGRTTEQLHRALTLPGVVGEEIVVDRLGVVVTRGVEIDRVAELANRAILAGRHVVLFTSRELITSAGRAGDLTSAALVSEALVELVQRIQVRPRFFIAKSGITSSTLATDGMGIRRALVAGQAAPGIPVWRLGTEGRFPGLAYVVFPGNVGGPDTLRDLLLRFGG
jgi:uncharacterized protein YgbK (DUF1537 family)